MVDKGGQAGAHERTDGRTWSDLVGVCGGGSFSFAFERSPKTDRTEASVMMGVATVSLVLA